MTPQRPAPPPPQAPPADVFIADDASEPDRILIYGQAGVGKSTLASAAPRPVLVPIEKPGNRVRSVVRAAGGLIARQPESWADLLAVVRIAGAAPGETLILDGLTQAEGLAWRAVCETAKVPTIEDVGGGWGKGYSAALDRWRELLLLLERIGRTRRIVLVGHGDRRVVRNPEGKDYDEWALCLQHADKVSASGLVRGWCDAVLFACWETFSEGKDDKGKMVTTGRRILRTQGDGPWQAKNRHGLPPVLDLEWAALDAAMKGAK